MCGKKFVLFLSLLSLALLSAPAQSTSSTEPAPEASGLPSQTPSDQPPMLSGSSETPDQASDELLIYADRLDQMSNELKALFQAAGISLTDSEGSLLSSADSVQRSIDSIKSCEASIQEAQVQARRHSLTAGLWRALGCAGVLGVVGALLDSSKLRGAVYGVGAGALAGGVWFVVDIWPRKVLQ
jgi:hypothetical protein